MNDVVTLYFRYRACGMSPATAWAEAMWRQDYVL